MDTQYNYLKSFYFKNFMFLLFLYWIILTWLPTLLYLGQSSFDLIRFLLVLTLIFFVFWCSTVFPSLAIAPLLDSIFWAVALQRNIPRVYFTSQLFLRFFEYLISISQQTIPFPWDLFSVQLLISWI